MWAETGISFASATEAGAFLTSQGFTACDGGFEKLDDLNGGRIFASYLLTNRKCYIRILDTGLAEVGGQAIEVALTLLAESIEDGNGHLFPDMSAEHLRALAQKVERK